MPRPRFLKYLRPRPPIWDRPGWDEMPWEEKMAIWKRHRKYNALLASVYLVTFLGSLVYFVRAEMSGGILPHQVAVVLCVLVVEGICLFIGGNLMD